MTESTPRVTTWGGASLVSTAGITPGFPTITSYTSVPTTSTSGVNGHIGGNNIGVTVNHGNETSSHVATYIGLACGLLVSIAIASVVIIRCRRKRTSRQKKEEMRLSFTDIQPYACSGEEKEGYMDVTETPPVLCEAAKSNVLDSACVDPASVYCTIADRDLTQVNQSAGNKTANVTEPRPPIRPRRYSLTQLSQDVEETIGVREVAEFCMDGNVYSELTNVGQSSPEDHPPALDCTAQVAEGGHKTATATGVYNKLNSNGRGSSGLQVNVLKSYNMAAGQLEVSKKDRESSEKNDITGQTANPYCLAREPNAVQKTQSSEANVDGSDGQSKNHTVDNNCHIIQAVAACSRVGGKENTYEQTDLNNSDLFDGGSTNNISRTDVSQESTGCLPGTESTEYFELEAGDDPYLVSGIPVPEQNEHTPNQTEEYFVLEDNEEGNVEGECRGVVGDDGFHEYHKPMHDHGVDDVHIYHEIQSGYEKTEYAELD
ncbi:hypothetical protein EGW08_021351 [Elysia chlorotica]|uniref:Uncharacterized protein n=1 Tax=Elysia chlorotica TaxID=188477 RepID=A0A3S1H2G7_ELYCH|nr:hypothetical protein EGW08_021351 [Elysia chlorotica]